MSTAAKDLAANGFQAIGEVDRVAQRDHVAAIELVDLETQPLAGDPSLEVEWEHPIVAAWQDPGRRAWPGRQRPGLVERRRRLVLPRPRLSRGGESGWHVVACRWGGHVLGSGAGPFGERDGELKVPRARIYQQAANSHGRRLEHGGRRCPPKLNEL
jgi:hypothetical protein